MNSYSAGVVPTEYILEVESLGQKVNKYVVLLNTVKFTFIGMTAICISISKKLPISSHPCQQNLLLVGEMWEMAS